MANLISRASLDLHTFPHQNGDRSTRRGLELQMGQIVPTILPMPVRLPRTPHHFIVGINPFQ